MTITCTLLDAFVTNLTATVIDDVFTANSLALPDLSSADIVSDSIYGILLSSLVVDRLCTIAVAVAVLMLLFPLSTDVMSVHIISHIA